METEDQKKIILTMQRYRKDIIPLIKKIKDYIETVGGANRCTIKEEVAIKSELFGINSADLPEIADKIIFF